MPLNWVDSEYSKNRQTRRPSARMQFIILYPLTEWRWSQWRKKQTSKHHHEYKPNQSIDEQNMNVDERNWKPTTSQLADAPWQYFIDCIVLSVPEEDHAKYFIRWCCYLTAEDTVSHSSVLPLTTTVECRGTMQGRTDVDKHTTTKEGRYQSIQHWPKDTNVKTVCRILVNDGAAGKKWSE